LNTIYTNNQLIAHLQTNLGISEQLTAALQLNDRRLFIKPDLTNQDAIYLDIPLPIGYGQTISQPTTVAILLKQLAVQEQHSILDIGAGSGWTTALLASLVGEQGRVIGTERIVELVEFGDNNLNKFVYKNAQIIAANHQLGVPGNKFDRILVNAAASEFPEQLISQLNDNGKIVIPIQNTLWVLTKQGNRLSKEIIYGFQFVPLILD
jgi:protein-L-isoaspartate(D-aspartate) O-methyltransferase